MVSLRSLLIRFLAAVLQLQSGVAVAHCMGRGDGLVVEICSAEGMRTIRLDANGEPMADHAPWAEGASMARPIPKPGWDIAIETRALPHPVSGGHGLVREAPASIAWRGGPLADAHYDEFVMKIRAPDQAAATLIFPVVQRCEGGAWHAWVEVAEPGQPRPCSPAPTLRLGAR